MTNKEKAEVYREAAAFLQKDGWMIPTEKLKAEADRIDPPKFEGHSLGPWRRKGWSIIDGYGILVCKIQPWDSSGCRIDDNADAELIAAAPDLLAERDRLQEAVRWFLGISGDFPAKKPGDPPYWFRENFRTEFPDVVAALKEAGDESST